MSAYGPAVFVALALAGCGHARRPMALTPCSIPNVAEGVRCATLDVPEDRARPEARRLSLPVVVLPAVGRADRGTPLFVLLGGPGAAATAIAPLFATELAALRAVGDVVFVDQRGTGSGPSSLACRELDDRQGAVWPDPGAVRACRGRLEARADLRFYGTLDAARDLDEARAALGYDRINIDATSYGTRLAQVYLRLHPSRVNAMVLFGTVAMDVHLPSGFAENAQGVVDAIVEDCARDDECRRAFPDVRGLLARALAALPADADRVAFSEWVRHRIYSAAGARALPAVLARIAAGDVAAYTSAPAGPAAFRDALLLTVSCSEDEPAIDQSAARARARATWFGFGRLERQTRACALWPRAAVPRGFYDAVTSDVPVLAIAGGRDPVTPVAYARRATARMPRAQVVVVPQMGHEPDGLDGIECLLGLELAFLRDPTRAVDTSCVAATAAPPFTTGER